MGEYVTYADYQRRLEEPEEREDRYVVGCDLGQTFDYTALCVVQAEQDDAGQLVCAVRHLERFRGERYPDVVTRVHQLTLRPPLAGRCDLIVDATGVGTAVSDIFRERSIKHKPVWIHGGEAESVSPPGEKLLYKVPKTGLISFLSVLFHDFRFKIVKDIPHQQTLIEELQGMQRKQNMNTGHQTFMHREGEHDDLVLAAALAAWGASKFGGGQINVVTGEPGPFSPSGPGERMPFSITPNVAASGFSF